MGTRSKGEQGKTGLLCCAMGPQSRQGGACVRFLLRAFAHFPRVLSHTPSEHTRTRHSGRKRPARWRFPTLDCSWRACRPPLRPMALGRQQPKGSFCPLGCEKKYGKRGNQAGKRGGAHRQPRGKGSFVPFWREKKGLLRVKSSKTNCWPVRIFGKTEMITGQQGFFLRKARNISRIRSVDYGSKFKYRTIVL